MKMSKRSDGPWVALAIVGGLWLALYLSLSLWVFLSHVGPSLRVELAAQWALGQSTPVSVELRAPDRVAAPLPKQGVSLRLVAPSGQVQTLGQLPAYAMRKGQDPTRAQGQVQVPASWPEGPSSLEISLVQDDGSVLLRACTVQVASSMGPARSARAMAHTAFVQEANQSQEQPKGALIHLVPAGAMRPGLDNRFWLQVLTPEGKPYKGRVQISTHAGTFRGELPAQALPETGLLSFHGQVHSETVTFAVELVPASKGKPLRRRIQIRAFPGASSLEAKVIQQGAKPVLATRYRSLSKRRRASVDVYDDQGHWLAVLSPPQWPQEQWREHPELSLPAGALQLEAYASVRRLEPDTPSARVWMPGAGQDELSGQVAIMRKRVTRFPKKERPAQRAYLDFVRAHTWSEDQRRQLNQWLSQALPLAHYAGPLVLDTHTHALKELAAFRARWTIRLRVLLWGGGLLLTLLVSLCLVRAHRRRMAEAQDELAQALVPTGDLWARVAGVAVVLVACMALLSMLMENLVAV